MICINAICIICCYAHRQSSQKGHLACCPCGPLTLDHLMGVVGKIATLQGTINYQPIFIFFIPIHSIDISIKLHRCLSIHICIYIYYVVYIYVCGVNHQPSIQVTHYMSYVPIQLGQTTSRHKCSFWEPPNVVGMAISKRMPALYKYIYIYTYYLSVGLGQKGLIWL